MTSEKKIESAVVKHAEKTGWLSFKFTSMGNRGVPDRVFIKDGKHLFIEFKATGKKIRPLQKVVMEDMKSHGAHVVVVDSLYDGQGVLDAN